MRKILSLLMVSLMAVFNLSAKTLYLAPNDGWKSDGARFAVYAFGSGDAWYSMTAVEGEDGLYQAAVDDKYTTVIFCRMNGSAAENNWDNRYNQTQNMDIEADKNLCNISGWDNAGAWGVYTPAAPADEWAEIKFTAATTKDTDGKPFNDSVFTAASSTFALRITDTKGAFASDANPASFGSVEDRHDYTHRLKTGGKSSKNSSLKLTIPADGQLRIAVRTGSNSATDRTLVIKQGDTLYNQVVVEADTIVGVTSPRIYKYVEVYVHAGEVEVTYPVNGLNFYGFAFKEGEIPPVVNYETLKLVPGVWDEADAKMAVYVWGDEIEAGWSAFFAGEGDTLSALINEKADSMVLVRFNPEVAAPTWENENQNVWNKIDKIEIDHEGLVYTVTDEQDR